MPNRCYSVFAAGGAVMTKVREWVCGDGFNRLMVIVLMRGGQLLCLSSAGARGSEEGEVRWLGTVVEFKLCGIVLVKLVGSGS